MKKAIVKTLKEDEQKTERNLVLKERKVYILKNKKLRLEVIQLYYDILAAGHESKWKIIELVTRNYQQLEIIKNI